MNEPVRRVPLVEVSDLLAPGAPLPFRVLDAHGRLLLATGQRIADARQLAALMERGACVEWPEVEAVRRARAAGVDPGTERAVRRQTLFDRWEQAVWKLDALLRVLGRDPGQRADIDAMVSLHIALVDRDADAALFLCMRQDDRRFALYALTHALHTATVALLAARTLGWPAPAQHALVGAALTMNVSIVELQGRMAEQSEPPTKKQIETIRSHPERSAELLRAAGVDDPAWLDAVLQHHERPGPGGYPRGTQPTSEAAHVLRAADVFMAKVSPRALRAPMLPQQAARQLFQDEGGGPVAGALIKAIGVHPPGDFVKLKNGEAAIVVHRAAAGAAVQVAALLDARGRPISGTPRRDTAQPEFGIAGPLQDRAGLQRVLPEQVYGLIEP
jgi:HD-GYP domain-containing protein (c-di-GMP phosphodiesterase class II)